MTPHTAHAVLLFIAMPSWHLAVAGDNGDESCSANSNSAACRGSGGSVSYRSTVSAPPKPLVTADLITQEVEALDAYIKLCEGRIQMLDELREVFKAGYNLSLPESHMSFLNANVPRLSSIPLDPEEMPHASADDYVMSKSVIRLEDAAAFVKLLPLRSPSNPASEHSTSLTVMPSALVVAATLSGTVRLFTPAGELALSFSAGHEFPVCLLTVSPSQDEYVVVTGDTSGIVRVHRLNVRVRRSSKQNATEGALGDDEMDSGFVGEKVSAYLRPQLNVTFRYETQLITGTDTDGDAPRLTSVTMAQTQQNKYFVLGDAEGRISVFTKNGTLKTKIDATTVPGSSIEQLSQNFGNLVFSAGSEWGFVDLETLEVKHVTCEGPEGRVKAAIIDSQRAARVLLADDAGSVWVLDMRNKKECRLEHRFAKGMKRDIRELGSVNGFAVGLEGPSTDGGPWSVAALNMSIVGRKVLEVPSPVVWRHQRGPVKSWAVLRNREQGDLMAFLSEDGHEIEVMDLLMSTYTPIPEDQFGDFKLHVVGVALILVCGYQYMKQKDGGRKGKFDMDAFSKNMGKSKGSSEQELTKLLAEKRAQKNKLNKPAVGGTETRGQSSSSGSHASASSSSKAD